MSGVIVDIGLFPIDTIKTRIQSGRIIVKGNIFSGLKSTFLGSFPSSAAFFISYDYTNLILKKSIFLL